MASPPDGEEVSCAEHSQSKTWRRRKALPEPPLRYRSKFRVRPSEGKLKVAAKRQGAKSPIATRYQFTDGQGRRRDFATKAKARLEAAKDKALYHQEGRLAASLTDEQRRDAASAVKLLPFGWSLT